MKFSWLTDIHLNFIDTAARLVFYQSIVNKKSDGVLITGDIAEGDSVLTYLEEMEGHIQKPIYFVLGNHDYFRVPVDQVKKMMTDVTQSKNNLYWLPASGPQIINDNTIFVGQDGWADGRYGDYANSSVSLMDSRMIPDLHERRIMGKEALLEGMQALADGDAKQLRQNLTEALSHQPKRIVTLTHVPPFKEASMFEGKISGDEYLPYFSSKATGDVLLEISKQHPEVEFLVLCGHTHHRCTYKASANLLVEVGQAEYLHPEVQRKDLVI